MYLIKQRIPVPVAETKKSLFKSEIVVGKRHSNFIPCDGFEKLKILLN